MRDTKPRKHKPRPGECAAARRAGGRVIGAARAAGDAAQGAGRVKRETAAPGAQQPAPEPEKPPIGREEIAKAADLLQKYRRGKAALDRRIIDNDLCF